MGRSTSSFLSASSDSDGNIERREKSLLPMSAIPDRPRVRLHSLLSRVLNRRVLVFLATSLVLIFIALQSTDSSVYKAVGGAIEHTKPLVPSLQEDSSSTSSDGQQPDGTQEVVATESASTEGQKVVIVEDNGEEEVITEEEAKHRAEDLKAFPCLNGYFNGLRTLVGMHEYEPEYPNKTRPAPFPPPPPPPADREVPKPRVYNPYTPDEVRKVCHLDPEETIPAPDLYNYDGLPQNMPKPAIGSHELLGIRNDVCFDRFGRFGPYGLGYSKDEGGSGMDNDTERSGSAEVWSKTGKIRWDNINWHSAQTRCFEKNKDRFFAPGLPDDKLSEARAQGKRGRTAIVIRTYTGFKWTELAIINFRALISETALKTGSEYNVHFLLHVRDNESPIWADDVTANQILEKNMPREFHGLTTMWSTAQMKLYYAGEFGDAFENESKTPIHGVYRSAHFPLQVFSHDHPEYEHIWNWEMDMRYLGNYYELFERLGVWADQQPRAGLWERNERYYIPDHHGTWETFTENVRNESLHSGKPTIFGPQTFVGKRPLRNEQNGKSPMPESCSNEVDNHNCGIGEAADLITFNPIFDADKSGWVFELDATGYTSEPPRRCAIVTASRLSRRLLSAMHEEVWRHHHTMFSEMFPPSVALHQGLKAVFAPHPVYIDRAWMPHGAALDHALNSGSFHSTSNAGSPFDKKNEHNHKGSTWYFNSEFSGLLWRRWLGYAQLDGRSKTGGGRGGEGTMRGGKDEEESADSLGRMCLPPMLLHPIKHEHPSELLKR